MRLLLADGTLVDTGDADSVARFRTSHGNLLAKLDELGRTTRSDAVLAKRIRDKFAIKNTTGYSINALVDFEDPLGRHAGVHRRDHLPHRARASPQGERTAALPRHRGSLPRRGVA
jgi:hypothetical protein